MQSSSPKKTNAHKHLSVYLPREAIVFIDKLIKESLASTDTGLSRDEILSAFIEAAMHIGISADGITSQQELVTRIINTICSRIERRKYPRINKNVSVRLRRMESLENFTNGLTKNISFGGFMIEACFLDSPPTVNEVIEVVIEDPLHHEESIKAVGRIVWTREKKDEYSHEVGIMITYMKKEDRSRFKAYLEKPGSEK